MALDLLKDNLKPDEPGFWITTAVTVVVSFSLGAAWSARAWPLPYGARAEGTIIRITTLPVPLWPLHFPAVEYSVGGQTYQTFARLPDASRLTTGGKMTVHFDSSHPEQGRVAYESAAIVEAIVATIVFTIGSILFKRARTTREDIQKSP